MIAICVCLIILQATNYISAFSFSSLKNTIKCNFNYWECCEDWWTTSASGLVSALNSKVYGQHLAVNALTRHITARSHGNPSKAMALSFHGGTGTGKSHVTRIIVERLLPNGMKSAYVHLISALKDFPHPSKIDTYKESVRQLIETEVKECPYSIFIFDEIQRIPEGILNVLKPYLDFPLTLGGVDFRQATFLFLSNTGAQVIVDKTMEHWQSGKQRTDIKLRDMEEILRVDVLNNGGGFRRSDLITTGLITAYIPFLPLERTHVKQCIRDGLIRKAYYKTESVIPENIVQEIADEVVYGSHSNTPFAVQGCKRVLDKIDFVMSS